MVGNRDDASREFARRVPGVAAVTIPGARHEPLMEHDELREQFWAAFDAYVGVGPAEPRPSVRRALA